MHSRRLTRLNELILQTISSLILHLKDSGLGFITVTAADLAPDLSLARIYYSVLGSDDDKKETAQALERAKPHIRRELARLKNLKKIPDLIFVFDESIERADRVYRLLNTLDEERKNRVKSRTNDQSSDS